jgi:hypothetical protein
VKLTASDIHHALRSRPGFVHHYNNIAYQRQQSTNPTSLLFYRNHPVQFVCIVGLVVAFDDHERVWVLTVDDSSGATIDVTCRKPEKAKDGHEHETAQQNDHAALAQPATVEASSNKNDGALPEANAWEEVLSRIDIGSVVKVKGTIGAFRSVRQIALERLEVVLDTNAEVRFWMQRTQLFADVLSKPWKLSAEEQKQLLKEAEGEVEYSKGRVERRAQRLAKEQRREKRHAEKTAKEQRREKRHAERIAKAYEVEDRERKRVAEEMRQHGLDLQIERDKRERERTVEMSKGEDGHPLGNTLPAKDGVTHLRDSLSSK